MQPCSTPSSIWSWLTAASVPPAFLTDYYCTGNLCSIDPTANAQPNKRFTKDDAARCLGPRNDSSSHSHNFNIERGRKTINFQESFESWNIGSTRQKWCWAWCTRLPGPQAERAVMEEGHVKLSNFNLSVEFTSPCCLRIQSLQHQP